MKTMQPNTGSAERALLARDLVALLAVQASRPLRPPPYDFGRMRLSPAASEARADRKRGLV